MNYILILNVSTKIYTQRESQIRFERSVLLWDIIVAGSLTPHDTNKLQFG